MLINKSFKHATGVDQNIVDDKDMVQGELYVYASYDEYSTLSNGKKMLYIKGKPDGCYLLLHDIGFYANKNTRFPKGTVITLTQTEIPC